MEHDKEESDPVGVGEGNDENLETEQPVTLPDEEKGDDKEDKPKDTKVSIFDSYTTVDEKTRNLTHNKLKSYESRRRSAYKGKMESSSLYWRSLRDLLSASVHETSRAERLVLGTARANAVYADSIQASYEDVFVDDKGGLVLDPKKQLKLLEVRSTQDYDLAPAIDSKTGLHQSKAKGSAEMSEKRKSNMLSSLIDAQANIADKFCENSKELELEIASEMTAMRKELDVKVQTIREIGDTIISELEVTEEEVSRTWESYYEVAVKTLKGANDGGLPYSPGVGSPSKSSKEPDELEKIEDCLDVWLVEMHYRVAVAYQSFLWEKASSELSKLFGIMKETECQRRMDVREYLVAFIQRQERLYVSLPHLQEPVLKGLVARDMDHSTLEEAVQSNIQKRAERLAREEAKTKKNIPTPKSLKGVDPNEGNFTLQSPMQSELLGSAKIVERKGGMMSSWKISLAIVTVDSFLHLFDLPLSKAGKITLGSAPEAAFQMLVPSVEIPTTDAINQSNKKSMPVTNFIKGWCENLTPSESMVLPHCSISQPKYGRETTSFEIQEEVSNTGASKMFGKTTIKKITVRTFNKKETQEW
eukprot:CAMPEP_0194232414 /NCGR_PEP_ID=MMETSP0158-20130606/788_1 /TAXON_ID=33649 /ORGANISM="Thalassionema nitzschioides, Strain L26-B" /LENGTH=587 /DNA_ID=CAMNT_0038965169 /DNA_START=107 /DNA_END=1867 /DNA_ORIENTATION=+